MGLFKLAFNNGGLRRPYAAIFKGANLPFNNSMVIEVVQPANSQANYATISTMLIEDSFIANDISSVLLKTDGNCAVQHFQELRKQWQVSGEGKVNEDISCL